MDPMMSARTGYTGMSSALDLTKALMDARSSFLLSRTPETRQALISAAKALRQARQGQRASRAFRMRHRGFHGRIPSSKQLFAPGYFTRGANMIPLMAGAAPAVAGATSGTPAVNNPVSVAGFGDDAGLAVRASGSRMAPASPRSYHGPVQNLMSSGRSRGAYMDRPVRDLSRNASTMYTYSGEVSGLGADTPDFLSRLLYKGLGVGDPIKYWEGPNASLPAVWAKYSAWIDSLYHEASGILSSGARKKLLEKGQVVYRIMNPLKNAFGAGAIPGERDRDRLGEFVKATREFKSDLEDAKKEFGWAPPVDEEEAPPPATTTQPAAVSSGTPMWVWILGGAVAIAGIAAARRSA